MGETKTTVSVNELKRLIFSIVEGEFPVCIRYRLIGQLWHPNFVRILKITEGSIVLFHDEIKNQLFSIPDVSTIIQFELDSSLHAFEPNCHYQVTSNENYKIENNETNQRSR